MRINHLSLINFRNYHQLQIDFSGGINCLVGHNGAGKTNLIDAIHYLSFCKSYFNSFDSQNIYHDEDMFIIQGLFEKDGSKEEITVNQSYNEQQIAWFKAGGALNVIRSEFAREAAMA